MWIRSPRSPRSLPGASASLIVGLATERRDVREIRTQGHGGVQWSRQQESCGGMTPQSHQPKSHHFQGTIYKIWMLRYLDVPEEVGHALEQESSRQKHIPVVAILNGRSARTTLMPAGAGRYRVQLNSELRKAAQADTGDLVGIELRVDRKSRALPVPDELREALKTRLQARKAFEKLGPGTRRQLLLWLGKAKSAEVRQKRLARLLAILSERALLGRKH
jgi:Bacteriocin-protection, YdeI or OmpD-Associated/Domain of unknown function (DUF1905)